MIPTEYKICGRHQSELKHNLHLDHCHISDMRRGLLCFNCNSGLGSFKDNEQNLLKAVKYLWQSKGIRIEDIDNLID